MNLREFASRFSSVRWLSEGKFESRCPLPGHPDGDLSLVGRLLDGQIRFSCFSSGLGHDVARILANLGLTLADLKNGTASNGGPGTRSHFSDDVFAQLKANPTAAFETVLGQSLVRKGGQRESVARCPFHDDSKPSLRINLEKLAAYCDPCGKGWGIIDLAKEIWGCDFKEVARRLGHPTRPTIKPTGKPVRTIRYEIRDLDGSLKATHIRHEFADGSKTMPWEPSGIPPVDLPLFQIEKTIDSADDEIVIVCEGEKPAASLWARQVLAVGTVTGAGFNKPLPCDKSLQPLLRLRVCLWPDNDDVGADHMKRLGIRLLELGHPHVYQINWKEAPHKGDAADYSGDPAILIENAESLDPYPDRAVKDGYVAYIEMQSEEREYLLDGLIRFGSSALLTGLMEAGKSTWARCLARAVVLGQPFFERPTSRTKVLVIVSAKEYDSWADTIGFWQLRDGIYLAESTSCHFKEIQSAAEYVAYRMRQYRCRLLILDTLFDYVGLPAGGMNGADQNRVVMNEQSPLLEMLRRDHHAMLALGHQPKTEARAVDPRDPQESFAGMTGWSAQHRMRLSLRRKAQGVISFITGRGSAGDLGFEEERLVRYDPETRLMELGGLFKDHVEELAYPSVVEALSGLGVPTPITKLIDIVGKGEKWVRAGLRGARKQNPPLIKMVGKGRATKYVLPEWQAQEDLGFGQRN